MRIKLVAALATAAAAAWAGPAAATDYTLKYYDQSNSQLANLTVSTGSAIGSGFVITNIAGTSVHGAVTGYDFYADYGDQYLFPNNSSAYVDGSGLTYQVGIYSYNLYSTGGGFYSEYRYLTADPDAQGTGTFVRGATLTAATVPEPAAWALLVLGFGAIGGTLRARGSGVRFAAA